MPARGREEEFAGALLAEYDRRRGEIPGPFITVYFGGGTPSSLSAGQLARIMAGLPMAQAEELTVEANPDDVTPEWVDAMAALGVNRISMGVQSLDDHDLLFMGRRHSARQALDAITTLQTGGIANISCDLIYGLPGQSCDRWQRSLDTLLDTGIPHLSAYILSFEPGTRFSAMLRTGKISRAADETIERMYGMLCQTTRAAGMNHYEISNFAKSGMHSRHNSAYWDGTPYLGLGPGAHSFDGSTRRFNPPDLRTYIASEGMTTETEEPTTDSRHNDRMITGLRTARGITTDGFTAKELAAVERMLATGDLTAGSGGRLRIPERRWLVADAIILELIRA